MAMTHVFLHEHEIVYRDLKADNWMIDESLTPVLIDFGLAKILSHQDSISRQPATPEFLAPELWDKDAYNRFMLLNHSIETQLKADVYSFGLVLYMIYMHPDPFRGYDDMNALERLAAIRQLKSPPFDGCDEGVLQHIQPIIEACLDRDPQNRSSMRDICEGLESAALGLSAIRDSHKRSSGSMDGPAVGQRLLIGAHNTRSSFIMEQSIS
jgi:serine/threonine protein kinase